MSEFIHAITWQRAVTEREKVTKERIKRYETNCRRAVYINVLLLYLLFPTLNKSIAAMGGGRMTGKSAGAFTGELLEDSSGLPLRPQHVPPG